MRLATRISIVIALAAALVIAAAFLAMRYVPQYAVAATIAVAVIVVYWSSRIVTSRIEELHFVLGNALSAFRDGDFSLRLAVRGDRELAELKRLYNELADTVREDRREINEKEILLDTILQRTPVAVALLDAADRVIYSNATARQLLAGGDRVNDHLLSDLGLAQPLRDALASGADAIFNHEDDTFHVSQRIFHINTQRHRLVLIERLTPELRRQEIGVWKKAIRVINHEINNSVAPISSLFHSARLAQEMPEHRHRLDEIYGLIEERLAFLNNFLAAYAQFARIPAPRKEKTRFDEILEAVRALYDFNVEGSPDIECTMDRAQMQQVLINLVKNARESGGDPADVTVSIQRAGDECVVRVCDRGRGMSEDVMRQALLPFYSTKPGGSGVGLALSNEIIEAHGGRMRLQAREGGGTVVTCTIPVA